jgi:hypothetical protein
MDARRLLRLVGFVALVLLECGLILYTLRLVGLAIERTIAHDWMEFWLGDFPLWLGLVAAVALLRVRKLHRVLPRHPLWVAGGLVAMFAIAMLHVESRLLEGRVRIPDLGIWVLGPKRVEQICLSGHLCWTYSTDEHGLRNVPEGQTSGDGPVLAVFGDSFVFGAGVNDGDTLPAQLQRALAGAKPGLRVVDAGLAGLSLASYPAMIRYVASHYDADWLLLLMNRTDVVLRDINTRLNLVSDNVLWRLLAAVNFEVVIEYLWLASLADEPTPEAARALVERLDALVAAAGSRPLLVVSDWFPAHTALLASWFERHPDVGWMNVYDNTAWRQAETLPNDAHWSPKGTAVIVRQLHWGVLALLQRGPGAPPGQASSGPIRWGVPIGPRPPLDLGFLASPVLTVRPAPGDPSTQLLDFKLGELGEVQFEATRCADSLGALRFGNVCFVYTRPVSSMQLEAVRRELAEHEEAIKALRSPVP